MGTDLALSGDMTLVLAILALTVVLFVFEVVRVDVVGICVMVLLGLLDLVPPGNLFDGFASNAVMSIIAVMIIGAGLDRTGVMGQVAALILRVGGRSETTIMPTVSAMVGVISGFMQNVGATALFLPVVSRVAARTKVPMSRLLMPMGFCAIMGGTITMVGSSPLILLNDLLRNANESLPPGAATLSDFGLFSVTPVGLALLAAGILYFWLTGRYLLPKRTAETATPARTKSYFADVYGVEGDVYELLVTADSPLVGSTVEEAESDPESPFILALKSGDTAHLSPAGDEMIWTGSVIGVMGPRGAVRRYAKARELQVQPRLRTFGNLFNPTRAGISEAVIVPGSSLVGKTLSDAHLRKRLGISVLALNRGGAESFRRDFRDLGLQVGDSLVIHSIWRDLANAARDRDFVVVTDYPKEEQRPHKVAHALVFFALALGMIIFTDYRLSVSLMVGALGMVLTGVISIDEAYGAVSWKTVFLLASLIPLGYAVETTGTAAWIAQEILRSLGDVPSLVLQAAMAVLATFFSLVMSNVAATALLVPLAISLALASGADPALFALTVALATSNAFLIPTHQVNALIMGPGNYRVSDFVKVGSLMTVIFLIVMLTVVNTIF